jgi:hypothetical protein
MPGSLPFRLADDAEQRVPLRDAERGGLGLKVGQGGTGQEPASGVPHSNGELAVAFRPRVLRASRRFPVGIPGSGHRDGSISWEAARRIHLSVDR